jgi:hypothetical protein
LCCELRDAVDEEHTWRGRLLQLRGARKSVAVAAALSDRRGYSRVAFHRREGPVERLRIAEMCSYGESLGAVRSNVLALHLPISCLCRLKVLLGGRRLVYGLSARW